MTSPSAESNFTAPSPWCPHPERWHATDWESTEVEVSEMIGALCRAVQPDNVLETGTGGGQTTERLAEAVAANGHGWLFTVDSGWERQRQVATRLHARGLGDAVWFANSASLDWTPPDGVRFQLAFIDCDMHTRAAVFRHYLRWFDPGSLVAFHDISPAYERGPVAFDGGMPPLDRLAAEGLLRLITLRSPRGLALAEVL